MASMAIAEGGFQMIRVAVLVAVLVLPALCRADQVWRWEDSAGQLHYSNIPAHVPSYAEPLRGSIGVVRMPALPATTSTERIRATPVMEPATAPPHRGHYRHSAGGCSGGYPFGLGLNSTDPSELVKQASVLDALGVRWRNGCCE
jgi:hypothetical protein